MVRYEITENQRIMKKDVADLTHLGNLSYTARRQSGRTQKGSCPKLVVYWLCKDAAERREVMRNLGIDGMSVNGESEYRGDEFELLPYIEKGMIKVRMKSE